MEFEATKVCASTPHTGQTLASVPKQETNNWNERRSVRRKCFAADPLYCHAPPPPPMATIITSTTVPMLKCPPPTTTIPHAATGSPLPWPSLCWNIRHPSPSVTGEHCDCAPHPLPPRPSSWSNHANSQHHNHHHNNHHALVLTTHTTYIPLPQPPPFRCWSTRHLTPPSSLCSFSSPQLLLTHPLLTRESSGLTVTFFHVNETSGVYGCRRNICVLLGESASFWYS